MIIDFTLKLNFSPVNDILDFVRQFVCFSLILPPLFTCLCQSWSDSLPFDDTDLLARAVAEAADFPELAAARAHLARLRLRVRRQI